MSVDWEKGVNAAIFIAQPYQVDQPRLSKPKTSPWKSLPSLREVVKFRMPILKTFIDPAEATQYLEFLAFMLLVTDETQRCQAKPFRSRVPAVDRTVTPQFIPERFRQQFFNWSISLSYAVLSHEVLIV